MPNFGTTSTARLSTCHPDLQVILKEAVRYIDFSVVYGHRTPDEQLRLYGKGRVNGIIMDKAKVVTYCDGVEKPSKHNKYPSDAADIIPYPSGWAATEFEWGYLLGVVIGIADQFYKEGRISHQVESGAFWTKFVDRPHIQLIK